MKNIYKVASILVLASVAASASAFTVVNKIQKPSGISENDMGQVTVSTYPADENSAVPYIDVHFATPENAAASATQTMPTAGNGLFNVVAISAKLSNGQPIYIPISYQNCYGAGEHITNQDTLTLTGKFVGNPTLNSNVVAIKNFTCTYSAH